MDAGHRHGAGPGPTATSLLALGSATLGESGAAVMAPRLSAAWPGAVVAAPACTVRCHPGDNLAVHAALVGAEPGSVLVVEVGGVPDRGYFGEVLATAAQVRGVVGLVIDGGVRDVDALAAARFATFSSTIALRGATKERPGSVGRPVRVGGVAVTQGDWVVGDADGVVVVGSSSLTEVIDAGRARAERERRIFEELRAGRTTVELLGLDTSAIDLAPPPALD